MYDFISSKGNFCLFVLLLFTLPIFAQDKISLRGMKKVEHISFEKIDWKNIDRSKVPNSQILRGSKLYPADGYVFYGKDNVFFVFTEEEYIALGGGDDGQISTQFQFLGGGKLGSQNDPLGFYLMYCSCGLSISKTEGDGCRLGSSATPGSLACIGRCGESNTGTNCSFTMYRYTFEGGISIIELI